MLKKKWKYYSMNINGNLHDAARHISKCYPEWDVVTLYPSGGFVTIVVWREEIGPEGNSPHLVPDFMDHAADLLASYAGALKTSHTGKSGDWANDDIDQAAKMDHDDMLFTTAKLREVTSTALGATNFAIHLLRQAGAKVINVDFGDGASILLLPNAEVPEDARRRQVDDRQD